MPTKYFTTSILRSRSMCFIELPFEPKAVFGKVRAPVRVTLNGHTYRSTIAVMGGRALIPLRKSNREAAGLTGDETLTVRLELDTEARVVKPPVDLVKALRAAPPAWSRWAELSYSRQRECSAAVTDAKRSETRVRRIANTVQTLQSAAPRSTPRRKAT